MTTALFRAIVGPVEPLLKRASVPVQYRQATPPQTKMRGPISEPYEAPQPIVNPPIPTLHFPS